MKRVKRRYLALKLDCETLPTERELIDALWASISRLFGEVGASQTGLALINLDVETRMAVVRVSLATLDMARASFTAIISLAGKEASVHVLNVSGTLKALYSKFK